MACSSLATMPEQQNVIRELYFQELILLFEQVLPLAGI